jgi:hypothetical protein
VGAAAVLKPLHDLIAGHVMAAERLHGADAPVPAPALAKGKTDTGRLGVYVRDDRPFAGQAPPAALFTIRATARGELPNGICPASGAGCRSMRLPATTGCTNPTAYRGRSATCRAERMPGAASSS